MLTEREREQERERERDRERESERTRESQLHRFVSGRGVYEAVSVIPAEPQYARPDAVLKLTPAGGISKCPADGRSGPARHDSGGAKLVSHGPR